MRRLRDVPKEDDVPQKSTDTPRLAPPGDTARAAIAGSRDATDTLGHKTAFRDAIRDLTRAERGAWGERAVVGEARAYGHRILSEHADKSTASGYDAVSWDRRTGYLHVWEGKNYGADDAGRFGIVRDFNALTDERVGANAAKALRDLPRDDPERSAIIDAVQNNRVITHVRVGPDTDVAIAPVERLNWGNLDFRQYTYREMLRFL